MALFKILRGDSANLENVPLTDGYAYFTPDNGRFYIDVARPNAPINANIVAQNDPINPTIYRLELRPSIAEQAVLANKAIADEHGFNIENKYIADLSFDYATSTLTFTRGDGLETRITIPPLVQIKS